MRLKVEFCKGCKKSRPIVNRKHLFCQPCNQSRLRALQPESEGEWGKTLPEQEKGRKSPKNRVKRVGIAPHPTPIARNKGLKRVRKPTGEAVMFLKIWAERAHICTNCGAGLGNEARTYYFSHIKSKGAHPELRLKADNIQLLCFECHSLFDTGTQKQFQERRKTK